MQKVTRYLILFLIIGLKSKAQDAILISDGNFIRGEITGTDYVSVAMLLDDKSTVYYAAQNIKQFVWNGETYVSKPMVIQKKMEYHFFKILAFGKVNLYTIGEKSSFMVIKKPVKRSTKPSYNVGMGTGGMGGSISFGNANTEPEPQKLMPTKTSYYLEKPGSGPIQEISLYIEKIKQSKAILIQKMGHKVEIAERIKNIEKIILPNLINLINDYNGNKNNPIQNPIKLGIE